MAKIGLYVPETKVAELEAWREKLNFSQLFMEAFDRAVCLEKTLAKLEGDEMKEMVKRLQAEEEADFGAGQEQGRRDGQDWARKRASLRELRLVCDSEEELSGEDLESMLCAGGWLDPRDIEAWVEDRDRDSFMRGFFTGFTEGAQSVWDQVKSNF